MEPAQTSIQRRLFYLYGILFLTPLLGGGNLPWLFNAKGGVFLWVASVLILWAWVTVSRPAGFRDLLKHQALWPLWALALWWIIGVASADVLDSTLQTTTVWLAVLLFTLAVLQLRLQATEINKLLGFLVATGALAALYGIYQNLWGFAATANMQGLSADDMRLLREVHSQQRAFSFFPGSNIFGGFLLPLLPISVLLWLNTKHTIAKLMILPAVTAIIAGIFFSGSRGAVLGLVLAVLAIAAVLFKRKGKLTVLALFIVLLVVGYLFLNLQPSTDLQGHPIQTSFMDRLAGLASASDVSIRARVGYWSTAWHMGLANAFNGTGLGSFADVSRLYQTLPNYTRDPHNILLRLFAETGLVGMGLFVWFLVTVSLSAFRQAKKGEGSTTPLLLFVALSLMLLHSLIDIDFLSPAFVALFFLLGALILTPELPGIVQKGREVDPILRTLAATAVVVSLFILTLLPLMNHNYRQLALAAESTTSLSKAIDLNKQASDYWPIDAAAHYRLSRLHFKLFEMKKGKQDVKLAKQAVEQAIKRNPYNPEYFVGYADTLAASGEMKRVLPQLRKAAELYPLSMYYQTQYAQALTFSGDRPKGLKLLSDALTKLEPLYLKHSNPNGFELISAHFMRAAIFNDMNKWDLARNEYENVIKLCDRKGLVLNSYTSSHSSNVSCEQIKKQAQEFIKRSQENLDKGAVIDPDAKPVEIEPPGDIRVSKPPKAGGKRR